MIRSLGWEDPLEEGMATHSSVLAWRIPMDRETWWATVFGVAKSQTGQSTCLHVHTCAHVRTHIHTHTRYNAEDEIQSLVGEQDPAGCGAAKSTHHH